MFKKLIFLFFFFVLMGCEENSKTIKGQITSFRCTSSGKVSSYIDNSDDVYLIKPLNEILDGYGYVFYDLTIENDNTFTFKRYIETKLGKKYRSTIVVKADSCFFDIKE